MKSRRGGMVMVIVFLVVMIGIGALVFVIYRQHFEASGQKFSAEAHKMARTAFKSLELGLGDRIISEDECGNAAGYSERYTGTSCDNVDNDYIRASPIRDCCCCNVSAHVFDFGQDYAYRDVKFEFVPHTAGDNISVQVSFSQYPDTNTFVHVQECDREFNRTTDLRKIDGGKKDGFNFSCYIRAVKNVEDAGFRYVKLNTSSGAMDFARAEVHPALRLCVVNETDMLEPGKGYWVYSSLLDEENVTIPAWGYLGPIAIIRWAPKSAQTYENINFDATRSFSPIPGCGISQYRWDFGDGNTSNNAVHIHRFSAADVYKVTLRVRENNIAGILGCDGEWGTTYVYVRVIDQYPHARFNISYTGFYSRSLQP